MTLPLIAAFSLGVHLVVFLALGLVSDGNPRVRGYRWFVMAVAAWIALLMLVTSRIAPPVTEPLAGIVAHALPVIFLLLGGLPLQPIRRWWAAAIAVMAILLLPFTVDALPSHDPRVETAYYVIAWGAVAVRVLQAFRAGGREDRRLRRRLVAAALVAGTAAVGLLVALDAASVVVLLAAVLQAVVLYATVRLSIYRERAGASRTGTLAAEAVEHDRRAVVGEIAAMVAHEVRNPLTGVRSLAQRLSDDTIADERRRRYAALIVREVDRVERMIGALLGATARRPNVGSAETELAELFDDVALLVSGRFRRAGVQLIVDRPPSLVAASPREPLAQVILNLLLNAVAQAPPHSSVRLRATAHEGRLIEISVEDRGPGVRAEEREAIFAPFYSGTGGSGLGLAVVRRLCNEFGWTVSVDDVPGGGARFAVTVPLATTDGAVDAHRDEPAALALDTRRA